MKLNRYPDYLNGYQRISHVRKHFGLSERNWDDLINGRDTIPLGTYKQVLKYVAPLNTTSANEAMTQTDHAIVSLKKDLKNNQPIRV